MEEKIAQNGLSSSRRKDTKETSSYIPLTRRGLAILTQFYLEHPDYYVPFGGVGNAE